MSPEVLQVRLVERNKYRIPRILKTVPEDVLVPVGSSVVSDAAFTGVSDAAMSAVNTTDVDTPTTGMDTDEPTPTTTRPNDDADKTNVCSICGYGAVCPPIRHEGKWQGEEDSEPEGMTMVLRSERPRRTRDDIVNSWQAIIDEVVSKSMQTPSCFQRGNRGCFWRCLCCGTTVHECCMDFSDHWFWYEQNHVKCKRVVTCVILTSSRLRVSSLHPHRSLHKLLHFSLLRLHLRYIA